MKTRIHWRPLAWFVAALVFSGACLILGQADDAPGLGGIGLLAGLAMILHALRQAGRLRKDTAAAIMAATCGILATIAPLILTIDHEIPFPSPFWLATPIGLTLLAWARKRWQQ